MTLDLAPAEPVTCPLLGMPDDPRTRFSFATPSHRCYAGSQPSVIDLGYQGTFCLAAAFPECGRFRAAHGSAPPRRRVASVIVGILVLLAVFGLIGYAGRGSGPVSPGHSVTTATPGTSTTGGASTIGGATDAAPTPRASSSPLPTPTTAVTSRIHIVIRGDTLISIAARYGVTVEAIKGANQIANPNLIRVGARLVIPPPP